MAEYINFKEEIRLSPLDLKSDQQLQSRAHAWERALPVFSMRNGLYLETLESGNAQQRAAESA